MSDNANKTFKAPATGTGICKSVTKVISPPYLHGKNGFLDNFLFNVNELQNVPTGNHG